MLADNEMAVASYLPRKMQSEILPGTNGQQQPEAQLCGFRVRMSRWRGV